MESWRINQAYWEKIHHLVRWDRYQEALREAEDWMRASPENPEAMAGMAHVYQFIDKDKALHWSAEALRHEPEQFLAWRVRLVVAYEREDWRAFEDVSAEMLRMYPEEGFIYRLRAQHQLLKGRIEEAREGLEQALELDQEAQTYAVYAYALAMQGQDVRSAEAEAQALREDPEDDIVLLYASWAADKRGEYKRAIELMRSAIRLDPNNAQIREEYLAILQKQYWFYRAVLAPNFLRRMKGWQILLLWIVCWALFKPLIILFIILYIASHWTSKLLVHVSVFGWRLPPKR